MGQLGGEDIAQAPHVNGQLGKSKTTRRAAICVFARATTIRQGLGHSCCYVLSDNATQISASNGEFAVSCHLPAFYFTLFIQVLNHTVIFCNPGSRNENRLDILARGRVHEETFNMQSGQALVLISCILGTIIITFFP